MTDPAIGPHSTSAHVAFWHHVVAAMLIFGFIAAGWARLNDCDLFNPDSPRYLIYAQSIADHGEYRAIDTPGAPLYTWRPPGLPILLAPVLKFFPYNIVAAKCVVLMLAAVLLGIVYRIGSIQSGSSGLLMLIVVASSPLFLSLSTEVLTEVPYALGILLAIYWMGRWNDSNSSTWRTYLAIVATLAFTPVIRTVGVALVAAVGLWTLPSRRRWRLWPAVLAALAGLGGLALRSRSAPGGNYAGSLLQSIREDGLPAVLANAVATIVYYANALPGVLLPGFTKDQTFYAPMVIGVLPSVDGFVVAAVVTGIVMIVSLVGMWRLRVCGGSIALLYLPLYGACLAIWPWRHERFLWPLVPMIWAFAPAGAAWIVARFPLRMQRVLGCSACAAVMGICGWQWVADAALIRTSQSYMANREAFFRDEVPGFYFGEWRAAGDWIRKNTPNHARILAWQAAVGGTAHRFQRRVQFEASSPENLHQQIAAFSARYLVVNDCQFGVGFQWQQLSADPAYKYQVVHRTGGVAVLEVEPNRTGVISRTAYAEWVTEQQAHLDVALERNPNRIDLLIRKAELLQESGRNDDAVVVLQGLFDRGAMTVRVCSSLGWLYLAQRQFENAARYLEIARGLPNAEPVAESLAEGARMAREASHKRERRVGNPSYEEGESKAAAAEHSLRCIQGFASSLSWNRAEREVDQLLELAPDNAAANYWRGYLHHLFGELEQADAFYTRAVALGSQPACSKLILLRMSQAIEHAEVVDIEVGGTTEHVDPQTFESHVRLASLFDEHGWSGRSVVVLENAQERFGDKPEIISKLAELHLKFARPELAAPLYRLASQSWPYDKSIRQGLSAAEAALREPRFTR